MCGLFHSRVYHRHTHHPLHGGFGCNQNLRHFQSVFLAVYCGHQRNRIHRHLWTFVAEEWALAADPSRQLANCHLSPHIENCLSKKSEAKILNYSITIEKFERKLTRIGYLCNNTTTEVRKIFKASTP